MTYVMMTALFGAVGICIAMAGCFIIAKQRDKLREEVKYLESQARTRDKALDYTLRYYQLHLSDPYINRPGFEEKRCFHCHFPIGQGHHPECPWTHLRYLTDVLYPQTLKSNVGPA